MKTVLTGADHAGFQMKEKLICWLRDSGYEVRDFGTDSEEAVDYPDYVHPLCREIEKDGNLTGILVCGSGNGMAITANKHPGIRAALCWNSQIATLAKTHNNANVICLPARFLNFETSKQILIAYLEAEFEGDRHQLRIDKIPC
jgi:ribose 5-phosphate isomerase B